MNKIKIRKKLNKHEKEVIKKAERAIEVIKKYDEMNRKKANGEDYSKEEKEYELAKKIDDIEKDF